jgi:PAS domain S-box-containing protein
MFGQSLNVQSARRFNSGLAINCLVLAIVFVGTAVYVTHLSVNEEKNIRLQSHLEHVVGDFSTELTNSPDKLSQYLVNSSQVNHFEFCAFLSPNGQIVGHSDGVGLGTIWKKDAIKAPPWALNEIRTDAVEIRDGEKILGSILVGNRELTWAGTASSVTQRYWLLFLLPIAIIILSGLYTTSSVRPLSDIDHQLSRAAIAPAVTDLPFHTVPQRSGAAAGWNRIVARLNEQQTDGSLEQRLQVAVDSVRQTKADVVLNSLADGLIVVDTAGEIVFANRALHALFNLTAAESGLTGKDVLEVLNDYMPIGSTSIFRDSIAQSRSVVEETSRTAVGIGEQILRVARFPLRSETADERSGHVWSIRDITQQKLAERMRDQFLDSATHELRTPLANIKAYAETLACSDDTDVEQQKLFCNTINSEATRLARFIDDLLSISSFEVGSMTLSVQQVDVDRMLRDAMAKVKAQVEKKKIRFKQTLPEKLPYLHLDKDKFVAALVNLLGNAIKYTPEGGQVELRVTVEDEESMFRLDIADSGVGIAPEDLPKVFDKFFRSQDPRVQEIEGTGLGLSLTQEIIRLHGGDLTVQSKLDKGSVFSITLSC